MRRALLLLALLATGCIEPDFEPQTGLSRPRVLAVIADHPELNPGDEARVHAVFAGLRGTETVEQRWTMCLGSGSLEAGGFGAMGAFGNSGAEQFGTGVADPGCDPRSDFTTALRVEGDEAIVPGECADPAEPWRCTRGISELFASVGAMSGAPPALVDALVTTVGIALTVQVELWVDGALAEVAFKRLSVTEREALGTNPPPPRFAVGDLWMSPGADDPHVCVPELGERPIVTGLAEVQLRPDPSDVDWMETFPVLAVDGSLIEGEENAFYSWFATHGEFDPEISVAPARDTVWLSPEENGVYEVWVVVRDGHLGTSACRVEIEVVDVVPPYLGIERLGSL